MFMLIVGIYECKTLAFIDEVMFKFESNNIDEIYREIKFKCSKQLKPNEFFTVIKI